MNKRLIYDATISKNLPKIQAAVLGIGVAIVISLLLILLVTSASALIGEAIHRDICFHTACLEEVRRIFDLPLGVVKALGAFAVGFTAVMSLLVALGVYLANSELVKQHAESARLQAESLQEQARSSALQLNAVRFSSFRRHISDAASRCSRLNVSSIDITSWYFKIYPDSFKADISMSYMETVKKIADAMQAADETLGPAPQRFNLGRHQNLLIPLFAGIGIHLGSLPRLDYFILEDEAVDLICSVHEVFGVMKVDFGARKYRNVN